MKKIIRFGLLVAFLAISAWGFPQSTIDFETVGNAGWAWSAFENGANTADSFTVTANPVSSGLNTSTTVGKMVVNTDGNPWAGFECLHGNLGSVVLTASNSIIKMMVYKSVISPVGLQLILPGDAAQPPVKVSNTKINEWEELTFDFTSQIAFSAPGFDKIAIFPDWTDPRTAGGVSYFDNIMFGNGSMPNDTEPPIDFTATLGAVTSGSVQLLINATDNSGDVKYFITYGTTTVSTSGVSGVEKSFVINGLTAITDYSFSVVAKDLSGNTAANNPIIVTAKTSENTNTECSGTSTVSNDGTPFTDGYKYQFTTSGTDVNVSFEMLDQKDGLVAYLWNRTGGSFSETMMTPSPAPVFTKMLTGQTVGSKITVACKFEFAGGLSVTKDFTYTVGNDCGVIVPEGLKLPIDFEAASYNFIDFGGGAATVIANPQSSGINNSAKVAQIVRNVGEVYAGSKLVLGSKLDLSTLSGFRMKVYSARAGVPITFKLELSTNGGVNAEVSANTTVANAWETLTWDFTGKPSSTYDALTFLFDLNTMGDGSANSTFLFDDIEQIDLSGGLTQIDMPVIFEGTTVNYKLTDFGGNASVLGSDPANVTNTVAVTTKTAGSQTWAGTTIGTDLGFKTAIPFTATAKKISVRVYSPTAGIQIRLKAEDHANNTLTAETEATTTVANAWETLTFDFANVASGTNPFNLGTRFDKLSIFFNFNVIGADEVYYWDDVMFVINTGINKSDKSNIAIYPNPVKSSLFLNGLPQNATVKIYDMKGKLLINRQNGDNQIDVNSLAKGIYSIQISGKNGITTKKFVKE